MEVISTCQNDILVDRGFGLMAKCTYMYCLISNSLVHVLPLKMWDKIQNLLDKVRNIW